MNIEMLYVSGVDVSLPNGPGVNELQFIMSSAVVYESAAHYVIPSPDRKLPENFPFEQVTFLPRLRRRNVLSVIHQHFSRIHAVRRLRAQFIPSYVVIRASVMPVSEILIASSKIPAFIKTVGGGKFEVFDHSLLTRWLKPFQTALFSVLLARVTEVDVVSQIHKLSLEKRFPTCRGKVRTIDNAVDTNLFYPVLDPALKKELGLENFSRIVGYVGNLAHQRGAAEMIQAWSDLEDRESISIVVISGDGSGISQLRNLAKDIGAEKNVFFYGPVPMEQVAKHISLLDVGVSLREDDGCSELKVRQYLACGVPVVVSAKVNSFVDSARLGRLVTRKPLDVAKGINEVLRTHSIATRDEISRYAKDYLSYEAVIRYRRECWCGSPPIDSRGDK